MVSSSTSAVMILYTSFTATTSFVVFGLLKVKLVVVHPTTCAFETNAAVGVILLRCFGFFHLLLSCCTYAT